MYPVNCPGIIFICVVSMGRMHRDNEKITGFNFVCFLFYYSCPAACLAINQDMLLRPARPFPVMKSCLRIITDIGYIQVIGYLIAFAILGQNISGKYNRLLALKTLFFSHSSIFYSSIIIKKSIKINVYSINYPGKYVYFDPGRN